ncbi:hypothetical protein HK101_003937 [Irineochytrium annulatum]|nr:hypothetical protein HK101_003937 [Irineochytrium annulatum]
MTVYVGQIMNGSSGTSFPFEERVQKILSAPVDVDEVEIKPSGEPYLPEIKYRRTLNNAFGIGGWGLIAKSPEMRIGSKVLARQYQLWAHGKFIAQATGEHTNQMGEEGWPKSSEAAKSNALVRCCKDLVIASELWDPHFIHEFKREMCGTRKNAKGGTEWFLKKRAPAPAAAPKKA